MSRFYNTVPKPVVSGSCPNKVVSGYEESSGGAHREDPRSLTRRQPKARGRKRESERSFSLGLVRGAQYSSAEMSKAAAARLLGIFALSSVTTLARARVQMQDVNPDDNFNCSCTDLSACLAEAAAAADPCTADELPTYNQGLHIAAGFIILVASMLGAAVPLLSKYHPFFRIDPFLLMLGKSAGERSLSL